MEDFMDNGNPWASIGEFHNLGLDYFIDSVAKMGEGTKFLKKNTINSISEFLGELSNKTSQIDKAIIYAALSSTQSKEYSDQQLINALEVSAATQRTLRELLLSGNIDPDLTLNQVHKLEKESLDNPPSPKRERHLLQWAFSVAKASIQ